MTLRLSYEMQKRFSQHAKQQELIGDTEIAFRICRRMGLQTDHNIGLEAAQIRWDAEVLLRLLRADPPVVDVNAQDAQTGETMLHILAQQFFPPLSVISTLLDAGASLHAKRTDNGETPLHTALRYLKHRLHHMANSSPAIEHYYTTQMEHGGTQYSKLRNMLDSNGQRRLLSTAEILLGYGADLTRCDDRGQRPIDAATDDREISAVVEPFHQQGRQCYARFARQKFEEMGPHELLLFSNVGLLGDCLLHPDWPFPAALTAEWLGMLAAPLHDEQGTALGILQARDLPQPIVSEWTIEHRRMPGPERSQG